MKIVKPPETPFRGVPLYDKGENYERFKLSLLYYNRQRKAKELINFFKKFFSEIIISCFEKNDHFHKNRHKKHPNITVTKLAVSAIRIGLYSFLYLTFAK